MSDGITINVKQARLGANIGTERVVDKNHAGLKNLDYASSGHTGFQPAGNYVEAQEGKSLTTNDFTDAYKTKVDENTIVRHTHSNKSLLDSLSSSDINKWNGKQDAINSGNNLDSDLVSDSGQTNKFVTATEKAQITYNQNAITAIKDGTNIDSFGDVETALSGKVSTAVVGEVNGIAELDNTGRVPSSQLPSYVDDVVEGYYYNDKFYKEDTHSTEITGENGKIYIDLVTNKTYRWSGTGFAEISQSLALGETSSTAYRGDRGKIAYDHATDSNRVTTAKTEGLYKVGVTNEGHISSATAITKTDLTDLGVEDASNKVTSISSNSTDTQYPSAKATYTYINTILGNIETLLAEV